jgi:hypothetical protein
MHGEDEQNKMGVPAASETYGNLGLTYAYCFASESLAWAVVVGSKTAY